MGCFEDLYQKCKMHAIVATCSQGQSPPIGARGSPPALEKLLKRYGIIFKAKVRVREEATPNFFKPRPVAYALRE